MKQYNINHYSTYSIKKASMAERVIRTIKSKLYKYFSLNGAYNWLDILPEITDNYNESRHSTTGYKPIDVTKYKENGVRKFKVGDIVRISKNKHVFAKGYTPNRYVLSEFYLSLQGDVFSRYDSETQIMDNVHPCGSE
ncbi:hypothetical protein NQ315_005942 [Exocentrus adspersus]|uniref:Integrase catalytic domain-containing protein n=1 Tax=Exocentrus adspersus TaxID=1586481 RepID=A0AAV8VE48_9CUCU|nr:hypothetical protein NQ315_005942 [Exocentrus adspersus]